MKKLILFARDPGGANTLLPLYSKLKKKYQVEVWGKEFALKQFQEHAIPCFNIEDVCNVMYERNILEFLKVQKTDGIVTGTSLDDYTERFLWKAANQINIKSFAILDQWINMGIRFSEYDYKQIDIYNKKKTYPYLPYRILVMDEMAKQMLILDGIKSGKIEVTGQPHFEHIYKDFEKCKSILDRDMFNIIYVSEPISKDYGDYWGFDEKKNFNILYQCLKEISNIYKQKIRLVIRPHPRENKEFWNDIVLEKCYSDIKIECDTKNSSLTLLKSADIIIGMSSMFLLESVICNKNVISIMIDLKRKPPSILHGVYETASSKEELIELLHEMLNNQAVKTSFEYVKNASQNVINYIEKEIGI